MGLFNFIAKKFSLGPAVKVWVDVYNNLYKKTQRGLGNRQSAQDFFSYIKALNIMSARPGDETGGLSFTYMETFLSKPPHLNIGYTPLLDLPSFLAIMMFFEIPLIREAVRKHPKTVDSILEIIFDVVKRDAPNGVISNKVQFMEFSKHRLTFLASSLRFI